MKRHKILEANEKLDAKLNEIMFYDFIQPIS